MADETLPLPQAPTSRAAAPPSAALSTTADGSRAAGSGPASPGATAPAGESVAGRATLARHARRALARAGGRAAAALPGLAVGWGGFVLAAQQPAAAAPETRYLAVVAGVVVAGAGLLAPPRSAAGGAAGVLATLALWVLPAGPGRGVALSVALLAALSAAAWRRAEWAAARSRALAAATPGLPALDLAAWAGACLAMQALLRPGELLPALLAPPAVARLALPPLLAAAALAVLARAVGPAAAAAVGLATALAAGGVTATAALPLLALAVAAAVASRGAGAPAVAWPGWPALATGLALGLPLVALRPLAGLLAAATAAAALLPAGWALAAAALPLAAALAAGRSPEAAAALWLLAALVPATLLPGALRPGAWRWVPGDRRAVATAAGPWWRRAAEGSLPPEDSADRRAPLPAVLPRLAAGVLLAAGGALLLEGLPGIAPGAAFLAASLRRETARDVALPWLAVLAVGGAGVAAYPWLRPEPLRGALELLGVPAGWPALGAAFAVAGGLALARGLRGRARRGVLAAGVVAAAAWVVASLPPRGRDLLRGEAVTLGAAAPSWSRAFNGAVAGVRVESLLGDAAEVAAGTPVARLVVERQGRAVGELVLRAGHETGEWAADRPDLRGMAPAGECPLASLPPPGEWFARAYRARWQPAAPVVADAIRVTLEPSAPAGATFVLRRLEVAR